MRLTKALRSQTGIGDGMTVILKATEEGAKEECCNSIADPIDEAPSRTERIEPPSWGNNADNDWEATTKSYVCSFKS